MTSNGDIEALLDDFSFLDDWEDRYRYVIELGKDMAPLDESEKTEKSKVRGCVSQVWLVAERSPVDSSLLQWRGESDAHIVQGLIAILLRIYNGKSVQDVLNVDAKDIFHKMGLDEHLSPQRSNGLASMVQRIRADAESQTTLSTDQGVSD